MAGVNGGESDVTPMPMESAATSMTAITAESIAIGTMRRQPVNRSPVILPGSCCRARISVGRQCSSGVLRDPYRHHAKSYAGSGRRSPGNPLQTGSLSSGISYHSHGAPTHVTAPLLSVEGHRVIQLRDCSPNLIILIAFQDEPALRAGVDSIRKDLFGDRALLWCVSGSQPLPQCFREVVINNIVGKNGLQMYQWMGCIPPLKWRGLALS